MSLFFLSCSLHNTFLRTFSRPATYKHDTEYGTLLLRCYGSYQIYLVSKNLHDPEWEQFSCHMSIDEIDGFCFTVKVASAYIIFSSCSWTLFYIRCILYFLYIFVYIVILPIYCIRKRLNCSRSCTSNNIYHLWLSYVQKFFSIAKQAKHDQTYIYMHTLYFTWLQS